MNRLAENNQASGASSNGGGGRMAGEERRQQIVSVAVRLFSQRGFSGTTTKEIAQAAGISEAMVFKHFATKDELYAAILDHKACAGDMAEACAALAGAIKRGDDAAVFEGLAQAVLHFHERDPDFMRLLLHSALQGHELFQMFWQRNAREMADFLRSYIGERQRAGALRVAEPLMMARAFVGMVVYHSFVNILFDPQRTLLDIPNEQAAREFTEILLCGITAPAKKKSPRKSKSVGAKKKK